MLRKFTLTLAFSALTVFFVGCGDDKFQPEAGRMDEEALKVVKEKYPEGIAYKTFDKQGKDKTVTTIDNSSFKGYKYRFAIKDKKGNELRPIFQVTCYNEITDDKMKNDKYTMSLLGCENR